MQNEYSDAWLGGAKRLCQQIGQNYIDVIVDQCSVDYSVIPALSGFSPQIKWQSLYKDLPEDIYPEDAPLLMRIMFNDLQQWNWLQALAKEMSSTAPLLILCSLWPLSRLGEWLTQITNTLHCSGGGRILMDNRHCWRGGEVSRNATRLPNSSISVIVSMKNLCAYVMQNVF